MMETSRPRAAAVPVRQAAAMPAFCVWNCPTTRPGKRVASASMAARVPSALPSSTRMSSPAKPPTSKMPRTRRASSSTLNSSLKQGTTTDSSRAMGAGKTNRKLEVRQERDEQRERQPGQRPAVVRVETGGGVAAVERHGDVDRQELLVDAEGVVQHAEAVADVGEDAVAREPVALAGRDGGRVGEERARERAHRREVQEVPVELREVIVAELDAAHEVRAREQVGGQVAAQ